MGKYATKNWRLLELLKILKVNVADFGAVILMAAPALPHIQYLIPPEIYRYAK
jgi:hypothetical protein